jgi:hypothetical protein
MLGKTLMKNHEWKDSALCLNKDTNSFFEKYEEGSLDYKNNIDQLCLNCPVLKTCFAVGVSGKEYGIWGGIYLEDGEPSREFNSHKTKESWSKHWQALTLENK